MKSLSPVLQSILITVASLAVWEFVARPAIANLLNKDQGQ